MGHDKNEERKAFHSTVDLSVWSVWPFRGSQDNSDATKIGENFKGTVYGFERLKCIKLLENAGLGLTIPDICALKTTS